MPKLSQSPDDTAYDGKGKGKATSPDTVSVIYWAAAGPLTSHLTCRPGMLYHVRRLWPK